MLAEFLDRRMPIRLTAALALALVGGCDRRRDVGPVVVSAIGTSDLSLTQRRAALTPARRTMLAARAQGLVRFDAAGQVEPALAERWIVIDDGRSYIFRLRRGRWNNGAAITAPQVAAALRRQLRPGARNPLAPFLSAIDEVVAMTPSVLEVRLSRPRPDLLTLFAQPEMAIIGPPGAEGGGPFRLIDGLLAPVIDPGIAADERPPVEPEDLVRLRGERAALAVARFVRKESDLVIGGDIESWPLLAAAKVARANIRIDPAAGIFGLVIATRDGFLSEPENRRAIARAIDREALTALAGQDWIAADRLLPDRLDSAADPAAAPWAGESEGARHAAAAAAVAAWRMRHGPVALSIALPAGPGGAMLWNRIAADLAAIGVAAQRVDPGAAADLKLVDAVAPYDSARWYLATACRPCSSETAAAIDAARRAETLQERADALAAADAALAAEGGFVPLARPLRWSLVALRLDAWRANPRAWHPLNHLRADTN